MEEGWYLSKYLKKRTSEGYIVLTPMGKSKARCTHQHIKHIQGYRGAYLPQQEIQTEMACWKAWIRVNLLPGVRQIENNRHKITNSYCFDSKGKKSVFHKGAIRTHLIISLDSIPFLTCHTPFLLSVWACPCLTVYISRRLELCLLFTSEFTKLRKPHITMHSGNELVREFHKDQLRAEEETSVKGNFLFCFTGFGPKVSSVNIYLFLILFLNDQNVTSLEGFVAQMFSCLSVKSYSVSRHIILNKGYCEPQGIFLNLFQ